MNKYYLWSAQAYNLIEKENEQFSLSEIARKILAPTRPNEDKEASVRAILTPIIFSRFFTDYNGNPFPAEEHLGNVLEVRYGVPRERVEEAKTLLRENGIFAGILRQESDGRMTVRLDPTTTGVPTPSALAVDAEPNVTDAASGARQDGTGIGSAIDFTKLCFVITPIGEDDSPERKAA